MGLREKNNQSTAGVDQPKAQIPPHEVLGAGVVLAIEVEGTTPDQKQGEDVLGVHIRINVENFSGLLSP